MSKKLNAYILRDKFNNIWLFSANTNQELTYEIRNNQNYKIHSAMLSNNSSNDFVVNTGEHNDIHIVLKNNVGDVLYYFFNGRKWHPIRLFKIGQHINSFKLLGLYTLNENFHILYGIQGVKDGGSWYIIDQYWDNNKWNHMKILESNTPPSKMEYCGFQDKQGNIYFVCQSWDGYVHHLQFNQIYRKIGLWNKSTLSFKKENQYAPNVWASTSNVYVVWASQERNRFFLNFRTKNVSRSEGNHWDKEKELYVSSNKIEHPFIFEYNGILKIYWLEDDTLLSMESKDKGETWEDAVHFNLKKPILYNCIINPSASNSSYIIVDEENKTYPHKLYYQVVEPSSPSFYNSENFFYPSNLSRESIITNKINLTREHMDHDKSLSLLPNKSDTTISIDTIKSLDDASIAKLSEDKTKDYLKIFRDQLILLYNELNNKKTKQSTANQIHQKINFTKKNMLKERHRLKIIENENMNLKSEVSEYKYTLGNMQSDIQALRDEIGFMDEHNRKLQDEITTMKGQSLGKRITNFFRGEY